MSSEIICYEFTATSCFPDSIALHATVYGLPHDLTMRQTNLVWHDLTECFSYAGHPRIAALLRRFIFNWNGAGTFTVQGPENERKEIFELLCTNFNASKKPGRPHSITVEFFQSQNPPHLTIQEHHGVLLSWKVDHTKPSPVFQLRAEKSIAC